MKKFSMLICSLIAPLIIYAQSDSTSFFKKRVLENIEIEILNSYYSQDGNNAAVTGGIGSEELKDFASDISISIPLKDNQILSISGTISAYTSASSSHLNPFPYGDDDDYQYYGSNSPNSLTGSPWAASSGASTQDIWVNANVGYSYYSNDRNSIYNANLSFANEYDYSSFGGGFGLTKLFNQKNTELSIKSILYFDQWRPEYPIEIIEYIRSNGNLNSGLFYNNDIYDSFGVEIDKRSPTAWRPVNTSLVNDKKRNTYAVSVSFSQILSKTTQLSIFSDLTFQTGWLANPMQRVYFTDKENFYLGNAASIPIYTSPENKDVFQLADDIERLPNTRFKLPIGVRLNQYINELFVFRTYYRYYSDDWGIKSHTIDAELAIKLGQKYTLYPNYRFYNQLAADYYAPFEQLLSTQQYYTSDFDLSKYNANQFGLGFKYTDILTSAHIWKIGLKNLSLDYNFYKRNSGLTAHIFSFGANFIIE